jgi:hypothetical protein
MIRNGDIQFQASRVKPVNEKMSQSKSQHMNAKLLDRNPKK